MTINKTSKKFSAIVIILIIALMFPSLVKLSHAIQHHKHLTCKSEASLHFHKKNLDCDFQKFKVANEFNIVKQTFKPRIFQPQSIKNTVFTESQSLLHFQYYSLRAPPQENLI
ncbi:hypothetical protein SAMN03097699_1087 [Flavobacteriaceae bacterium MAR_2010_188]|nr:hypothetical protein SAMN03097699_1087 [Flavobacteriaceae bacterium MAR_2010_188]